MPGVGRQATARSSALPPSIYPISCNSRQPCSTKVWAASPLVDPTLAQMSLFCKRGVASGGWCWGALLDSIYDAIERARGERDRLQSLKASAADALLTGRGRVSIWHLGNSRIRCITYRLHLRLMNLPTSGQNGSTIFHLKNLSSAFSFPIVTQSRWSSTAERLWRMTSIVLEYTRVSER